MTDFIFLVSIILRRADLLVHETHGRKIVYMQILVNHAKVRLNVCTITTAILQPTRGFN